MNCFLYENHQGSPLLNVLGVLGVFIVLDVLNVLNVPMDVGLLGLVFIVLWKTIIAVSKRYWTKLFGQLLVKTYRKIRRVWGMGPAIIHGTTSLLSYMLSRHLMEMETQCS